MGSCAAPSAKGDDKFITTDYLQQCRLEVIRANRDDWCTIIHSDIEATRLSLKTCLGQLS
ncbi:hypothetical protein FR751_27900 (plasmid) [Klebsiella pneumoniae]|nr:hypothetical protein FR751_27900 [Klebsiella pneumoniae]